MCYQFHWGIYANETKNAGTQQRVKKKIKLIMLKCRACEPAFEKTAFLINDARIF